ncbi:MAG: hypothetical protein WB580_13250, partial [Candidatus Binataceae bacterium]
SSRALSGAPAETESQVGRYDGQPSAPVPAPEPPHDLLTLLKLSKPAQILLTHDLYKQLTVIKGLPLKTFPGRFGVYEYLWTAEDKLDLLQSEPQLTLAAVPPAAPVVSGSREVQDSLTPIIPARAATDASDIEQHDLGMVQRWLITFRSPRNLLFASLALVAICAIALIAIRMIHTSSSQSANPARSSSVQGATPAVKAADHTTTQSNPSSPATTHAKPEPKTVTPEKQPVTESHKTSTAGETSRTPSPAQNSKCSLSGDLSRYLHLAEQDRGQGDYANAARIFHQVLDCDPSNAAAREGLNRAKQGQEQSQGQR